MAKRDEERGPVAAWARRERLSRRWKTHDVVRELAKRGVHIAEASYRGYEAGPRVSAPVRQGLEAVFGSSAPEKAKETAESHGLSGLIRALEDQTQAITRLAASLEDRQDSVPLSVVQEVVAQIVAVAPDLADLAGGPNLLLQPRPQMRRKIYESDNHDSPHSSCRDGSKRLASTCGVVHGQRPDYGTIASRRRNG